jgi:formiminotetrahydrofolate cyclodeaminase
MNEKLIDKPFKQLIDSISSKSAAPGGGSVAAAAGAFGAGLIEMSCKLTIGNETYLEQWEEFTEILEKVESYRKELTELIDKDSQIYTGIVNIRKSKNDLIDKIGEYDYNIRLQTAYKHAAEIPLQTAGISLKTLRISTLVADKGNVNSVTDTGVGAQMAYAGVVGGLLNIKTNLNSIRDETYKLNMEKIINEIEEVSLTLLNIAMDSVNSKL